MKRRTFTFSMAAAAGGALLKNTPARATTEEDRGASQSGQALRVLLGRGNVEPLDAQTFIFEGRKYRGAASALPTGDIVSIVPLEQYLYSVVSREMPRSWPAAALQAQAILARTYVLQRSDPTRAYDLVPSEADQMYTGMDAEAPATSAAVDATAGRALRFGGGFAQIAYSSCCGGHTESSADAWGGAPFPYLAGVGCTYCHDSPWYSWRQTIPAAKLLAAIGAQAAGIGELQEIALDGIDTSGRAKFWNVRGSQSAARVKASDVRRYAGTRALPSLLVRSVAIDGESLTVEGNGLGHGVGFCQWGARGLAQSGAGSSQILSFYFPGASIGTFSTTN